MGDLRKKTISNIEELKEVIEKADSHTMVSISLDTDEREVLKHAKGGKLRAKASRSAVKTE